MANLPTSLSPIIDSYTKNTSARVLKTSFGDGYQQRTADGINTINKEVSLKYFGTKTQIKVYTDYLESWAGATVFNYTLPEESTSEQWTCEEWSVTYTDDDNAILDMTIHKEYDL